MTGLKKADLVAVGVFEISLPPEPRPVCRIFVKGEAVSLELSDLFIEVIALEIENDIIRGNDIVGGVDREGAFAVGTLETGVTGQGIDNADEAELFKKLDRLDRLLRKDRYLI